MRERRQYDEPEIVRRLRAGESPRAGGPITAEALRAAESENAWRDRTIIPFARLHGWLVYFTYRSRRSPKGYLDLTCCRPPRLILAELKSDTGTVRPAQRRWLEALRQCPGVEVYLWTPRDWVEIQEVLA